MRYLVTGATGFLGGHLCRRLADTDQDVEVIRLGRTHRIEQALSGVDVVFHLAAQTEVGRAVGDPVETFEGNIQGTWRVLEACRLAKIKRVIVASSDKAYGEADPPYVEETPIEAFRPYEVSKVCADLIAQTYQKTYGMSVAVTRCGNLYGPERLNWTTIIPGTIKSVLRGEAPIIRSDGTMRRDFLFVEDAVDAYLALAESDVTGPFNFGTGSPIRVIDLVNLILKIMESSLKPIIKNEAVGEIKDQWLDSSLALAALGWKAKTTLAEGLSKTIPWYREYLA